MKKSSKREITRLYTQAELTVEMSSFGDGPERMIRLRFKTLDVVGGEKTSPGTTPWVTFRVPTVEHLSAQLAAAVEEAKRWEPGNEPVGIGSNMGVVAVSLPPGADQP